MSWGRAFYQVENEIRIVDSFWRVMEDHIRSSFRILTTYQIQPLVPNLRFGKVTWAIVKRVAKLYCFENFEISPTQIYYFQNWYQSIQL